MLRVSGPHEQLEAAVTERSADGLSAPEQLRLIREIVQRDTAAASETLTQTLLPGLSEAGIRVLAWEQISPERRKEMTAYFESVVFPTLTPLAFDPAHPFPFVSNLSLSLAVELSEKKEGGPRRFARVKVPASLPRFVPLPPEPDAAAAAGKPPSDYLLLEGLVEAHLDQLFPGMAIIGASAFRVTRDADFEIREDEAGDLLRSVTENVRRRRFGAAIRLEVEARCPENVRTLLKEELELEADDVYDSAGPMGLADFFSLWKLVPASRKLFAARGEVFEALRKGDVLVHHPYDSFDPVLRFLEDAATDPNVLAIKMTLYRTGADSPVVAALAQAAENGKQVAVLVELKARFDEENNIQWAHSLERAGVHVAYGVEGLKTHGKIALVVRREDNAIRRYVHIGTGNYNRATAAAYTDLGLFTARPDFGSDAWELFNFLTGVSRRTRYKKLTVAPFRLEEKLLALIDRETEKAREGKAGRILAKMNSLVASRLIKALYRASAAGVPIDLAVRGICCLRPGVPGVSETIRVSSVVGRFLEHSRAFSFGIGDEEEVYISSADWMPRNLFRRVELMVPILDEKAREKIRQEVFEPMLTDNARARDLQSDGTYVRRRPAAGEAAIDAQQALIDRLARRGIRAVPPT